MKSISETLVAIRGGGDLATGVIQKFYRAGFKVIVLETDHPLAIRRTVALCNAVFHQRFTVEDVTCELVASIKECQAVWAKGDVPLLIDPQGTSFKEMQPEIIVDAILAKKNLGTSRSQAPWTIGLGPGFTAQEDVDVVIETMRGHSLGRLFFEGAALPNTGVPGVLGGKSNERVIHSPATGLVKHVKKLGDRVKRGEVLFMVGETPVLSPLDGTLRGEIRENIVIPKGLKCGDVDPRPEAEVDWWSISDKARALGGAALEAAMIHLANRAE